MAICAVAGVEFVGIAFGEAVVVAAVGTVAGQSQVLGAVKFEFLLNDFVRFGASVATEFGFENLVGGFFDMIRQKMRCAFLSGVDFVFRIFRSFRFNFW